MAHDRATPARRGGDPGDRLGHRGANVKAAHVLREGDATSVETVSRPFEIWKDPTGLAKVLRAVAADLPEAEATGVTMTAELSDVFRTKREGVTFILDAMGAVAGVGSPCSRPTGSS